jgi:hydrogenase/urease accessory protein HupE
MIGAPLALLLALAAGLHPQSQSTSRVALEGAKVRLELRCQSLAMIEAVGGDVDGDGALDERELASSRSAIERYVALHYRLAALDGAQAKDAIELSLTHLAPVPAAESPVGESWVQVELAGTLPRPPRGLRAEIDLFRDRNPLHRDTATVLWNAEPPRVFVSGPEASVWTIEPASVRRPSVIAAFVREGARHILGGLDHLAFLLALLLAARSLRSLVATITAFTAAHSLTLALAALDVLRLPSRAVELAIALSIAYVALENLLAPRSSARWIEAFLFGLVHGLGFASFLSQSLVAEPLRLSALVGFNLGVELGQLAVVAPLALVLRLVPGRRRGQEPDSAAASLAPSWLRASASAALAALSLWWFAGRAGWV